MAYAFEIAQLSDVGTTMEINEDSHLAVSQVTAAGSTVLLAVADGVRGLGRGERASTHVISTLAAWWESIRWENAPPLQELASGLSACVQSANESILRIVQNEGHKMGTTLSVLLLQGKEYWFYHVGDTRIYCIKNRLGENIAQLTQDHTTLMPKVVDGATVMVPFLTECLGHKPVLSPQQAGGIISAGDMFLVCSDGVYRTLPMHMIGQMVRRQRRNLPKACHSLVEKAKSNGEKDNLTAIVAQVKAQRS